MSDLLLSVEFESVHSFEHGGYKGLIFTCYHASYQIVSFTEDIDQFLIAQKEESWELASLLLEEDHQAPSDYVAFTVCFHQHGQEVLLLSDPIHILFKLKARDRMVKDNSDCVEDLGF